jgi:hypothetical protein
MENGTILMFSLSGFQEFCNSKDVESKPIIAFNLLSAIYARFDELVETYSLFKVHSDSQSYVVLSDPSITLLENSETV